jgi:hypothetical protein
MKSSTKKLKKSTKPPKGLKREARLLIGKLREFELAYYLSYKHLFLEDRKAVYDELVSLISKNSGLNLISADKMIVPDKPKVKIKRLF